jgi:hypothetical protein
MQSDIHKLYNSLLAGELGRLEAQRKEFVNGFNRLLWIFFAICCAFLIIGSVTIPGVYIGALVAFVAGCVVLGIKYSQFATPFKAQFKAKVIPDLVKFVDERLHYEPHRSLMDEYHASQLYTRRYDRHRAEDTISGTFDKTQFTFGEVHTEYKVKTKNGTSWHTIFQGLLFVADFNKEFHGETIVDRDNMERMFGGLGRAFQQMNISRSGDLVRLENPVFEEKFAVYSTDEQECRYILTPALMERIVALDDRTEGQICLSFRKSNLYVAMTYRRDLFEPGIFRIPIDPGAANTLVEIITMMTEIVEDLNLNTRIWTKE